MKLPLLTIGLLALLFAFGSTMAAQGHDEQAKRITSQPEYKGYRIETRGAPGGGDPTEPDGSTNGKGYRRGSNPEGTPRRDTGVRSNPRNGGGGEGLSLPAWIGALFEAVAWIVLIGGAAVALFFIIKALLGIKRKPKSKSEKSKKSEKKQAGEPEVEPLSEEPALEHVFEDALAVALREYDEALARQDYAAATLLAYRIFWLRAGWRGCVESSDVRTWRDALRMVRSSETRREVRELLPMVERVRYAEYKPNHGEFNSWSVSLGRIEPQGVLK
ncbi:MAG: hypothetical protein H6840_06565 [Planctomycetes bacterium]|nr:hypothetical protein [Planctomycetota bacterium]